MSRPRLAFCITELDPGGAERALFEIVTRLPANEWERHVICLGPATPLAEAFRQAGVEVTCLGATSRWDAGVLFRLWRELRRLQPDLLQTFLPHANIAGRLAGRAAGVRRIVSGLRVAEPNRRMLNRLEFWTGSWADWHVAVSQGVAEFAAEQLKFPAERISVIPNGIDVHRFATSTPQDWCQLGLPPRARVLLGVGRLHPQKGFDLLIEAAAPLLKSQPDLHVVIAGEGPQRSELSEFSRQLGIADQVWLPGRTEDIGAYFKGAELFVLSSRWEGMANVLLEAIACQTPVLATRVEGVPELLGELAPQQIINPNSVTELRKALEVALGSPRTSNETIKSLYQLAATKVAIDFVTSEYARLYQRILAEQG